jgi:hypothetical protein
MIRICPEDPGYGNIDGWYPVNALWFELENGEVVK